MKMSKEYFEERKFLPNDKYKLADDSYSVNVFYNINANSPLEYVFVFKREIRVKELKFLDISQYKRSDNTIGVHFLLNNIEYIEQFHLLFDDLIQFVCKVDDIEFAAYVFEKRFNQWICFFDENRLNSMTELITRGLFGELYTVHQLLIENEKSSSDIITSWKGPEGCPKDFIFDEFWIEVKTIKEKALSITISSLEQLESEYIGELKVIELINSTEETDICINVLIDKIIQLLNDNILKNSFLEKFISSPIIFGDELLEKKFKIVKVNSFKVDENFPKLIVERIPQGILKCKYELDYTYLKESFNE